MTNSAEIPDDRTASPNRFWRAPLEIALVFAVFFLHGAWPTPDVNETGYIVKAQHFWNHAAFQNDFFANTGDAHTVYYWSFGWLTTLGLSLDTVAWIGRVVTWLMLAIAWRGLCFAMIRKPWFAILSAEIFLMLAEQAHMAGEWIVGGVEAKGFAWAFVLWAIQAMVYGRWNLALLLVGIATSLHVVVGGWAAVCLAMVWLASRGDRPAIGSILPGIIGCALLASPGLYFAWQLNHGVDWQTVSQANSIQVFERLPHHLLPTAFATGYVPRHLLLWALFFVLCTVTPSTSADRPVRKLVVAAIGLALIGFALAWVASLSPTTAATNSNVSQFAASLLRFYWSRMSDILVPMGVTLIGLQFFWNLLDSRKNVFRWLCVPLAILVLYDAGKQVRHLPWLPVEWGRVSARPDDLILADGWQDVCHWAANNTPPGTLFITPRKSSTFKWYAGRGEVATWKDMPQDAVSIVEWWRRICNFYDTGNDDPNYRWRDSLAELDGKTLRPLAAKYGAQYVIVELLPGARRLNMPVVYENKSYAVYPVGSGATGDQKSEIGQ